MVTDVAREVLNRCIVNKNEYEKKYKYYYLEDFHTPGDGDE